MFSKNKVETLEREKKFFADECRTAKEELRNERRGTARLENQSTKIKREVVGFIRRLQELGLDLNDTDIESEISPESQARLAREEAAATIDIINRRREAGKEKRIVKNKR